MANLRSVHCRFCRQTFLSDNLEKCDACLRTGGILDPKDGTPLGNPAAQSDPHESAALAGMVAAKQKEPDLGTPMIGGPDTILSIFSVLKVAALGVALVFLGGCLLVAPEWRTNPDHLSANEATLGVLVLLVGVAILAGLVVSFVRRR